MSDATSRLIRECRLLGEATDAARRRPDLLP